MKKLITFTILLSSAMSLFSQPPRDKRESGDYMNPERIMQLERAYCADPKSREDGTCPHEVMCFLNSFFYGWVCPNPYNPRHQGEGSVQDQFEKGMRPWIKSKKVHLRERDFQDPWSWNS